MNSVNNNTIGGTNNKDNNIMGNYNTNTNTNDSYNKTITNINNYTLSKEDIRKKNELENVNRYGLKYFLDFIKI